MVLFTLIIVISMAYHKLNIALIQYLDLSTDERRVFCAELCFR